MKKAIYKIIDDTTIHVYDTTQFNIESILKSGQIFRYFGISSQNAESAKLLKGDEPYCSGHLVLIESQVALIRKRLVACQEEGAEYGQCYYDIKCSDCNRVVQYFDLEINYNVIKQDISANIAQFLAKNTEKSTKNLLKISKHIMNFGAVGGVRILKMPFVECLVSFIISANNNIKRFTQTLNTLSERFGRSVSVQNFNSGLYAFPELDSLSQISEDEFRGMGCGYRAPYLVKTIRMLCDPSLGFDYEILSRLSNDDLLGKLCSLYGVGDKVARCIMLFAFSRYDVVPVDTWILKSAISLGIINEGEYTKSNTRQIATKMTDVFGKYAGIFQQYLFYYTQGLRGEFRP